MAVKERRCVKTSSARGHHILVHPLKRPISATVEKSSIRTVVDRQRLAAYHNKHCWRAFRGYRHRWPWTTENRGF